MALAQDDPGFGQGREIERGTYESRPGKPAHYFSEEELRETLRGFENIEIGRVEEILSHTVEESRIYRFYCASAYKRALARDFDGKGYHRASRHQKEWGNRLLAELDLPADASVLDLGCGDGVLTARLADRVSSGLVIGIDSSPSMIAAARKLARPNLRFEMLDINEFAFRDRFDLIFSNAATLHWVKDHQGLLARTYEALKPGGRIRFNFAGEGNCAHFIRVVRALMAEPRFVPHFAEFEWPWYMPSPEEYGRLLAAYPFTQARVWGESADRRFVDAEEMTKWIDQPSLVPFLGTLSGEEARLFRDEVVARMLAECGQRDGTYGEEFRRINVAAGKAGAGR